MRTFYDLCPDCKSELKAMGGVVYDMYPSSNPVKCTKCPYEGRSVYMSEAIDMNWSLPEDLRPKEETK